MRETYTDGLGRLAAVVEDPGSSPRLNYTTSYGYDALGNLTSVTQGSQQRSFAYDSLGRLVCASNPESRVGATSCLGALPSSGVALYTYDEKGNLRTRTDARGVVSQSVYDELNRLRLKTYSEPAPGPGEAAIPHAPNVTYCYDGQRADAADGACTGARAAYSVGQLTEVRTAASRTTYVAHDALGRVTASRQATAGETYEFAYLYNLADGLTQMTLPSGRVLAYGYDVAGRIASVTGTKDAAQTIYANGITYWPHGAVYELPLGVKQGVAVARETDSYNARLQLERMALVAANAGRDLVYDYGGTNNNGNVRWQQISGAGLPAGVTQYYSYDGANRLEVAAENPANASAIVCPDESSAWCRKQGYDAWGNGWVEQYSKVAPDSFAPRSAAAFDGANRLSAAGYDAAGNQAQIGAWGFGYDGENRQRAWTVTANGVTTTAATYEYDGEGRRVQQTGSDGATTVYVYDAFGQLAAEYRSAAAPAAPCATCYLIADHLGSTRLVIDDAGKAVRAYDYLPFGEEIAAMIAGRDGLYAGADPATMRFTGKERDADI